MVLITKKLFDVFKRSSVQRIAPTRKIKRVLYSVECQGHVQEGTSVLFVSSLWPERTSSAAGVRTSDLITSFLERGYRVEYASTSGIDDRNKIHVDILEQQGVGTHTCVANKEDAFVDMLDRVKPSLVLFDRFYTEEMFSFILQKHMPQACRILDMQDVHFLRAWRQACAEKAQDDIDLMRDIMSTVPPSSYQPCLRELASIYRSDLTLVCSPREIDLLQDTFGVDKDLLIEAGFFNGASPLENASSSFDQRSNFMMIGNFKHPPNADSVEWACTDLWPRIRRQLGETLGLHDDALPWLDVYGSYAHNERIISKIGAPEKKGVRLCGFAPTLEIMSEYRVLFAPLRFGAGLKGKVVDAWHHGLPVITTVVGSEGMIKGTLEESRWGGLGSATTSEDIVCDAVRLYTEENLWSECQAQGFELLRSLYDRESNFSIIHEAIDMRRENIERWRGSKYVGAMLWSQTMRSTEYFSKWIEEKERFKT